MSMKIKQRIALLTLLAAVILSGCSAEGQSSSSYEYFGIENEQSDSQNVPFDIMTGTPAPDTPYLQYLGSLELTETKAAKLYLENYADGLGGAVISVEYVRPERLAARLSERISADLSPDLCDKLASSYPYLMSKNLYEDLTAYIDLTAPQWDDYSAYIDSLSIGGARYFYPTSLTVSPNVLLYDRRTFSRLGLPDPAQLWQNGSWTRSEMSRYLEYAPGIGGESVLENFLAGSGLSLITADSGSFALRLNEEAFAKTALFVNENYFDVYSLDNALPLPNAEYLSFVSVNDEKLAEIRLAYPDGDFAVVPYPADEEADSPAYLALSEGFLVPKRAKNIKGAASFINCSRIAAENDEQSASQSGLPDSDIEILTALRSDNAYPAVLIDSYCLDDASNELIKELISEICGNRSLSEEWDLIMRDYGSPLFRAVSDVNESLD